MSRFAPASTFAAATIALAAASAHAGEAKNIIYLIADGAGYNTYNATEFYTGVTPTVKTAGWNSFGLSTYPLRTGTTPIAGPAGLAQDANTVYNSAKAWDTTPRAGTLEFEGYNWQNSTAPDSANTISAAMTGVKTYNNAVNVNGSGNPVTTFAEIAHQKGLRTGIVTSVQWADATPSAFSGVHNVARANRGEVSNAMLNAPYIDVIMGAGNPDYDNDGVQRTTPIYASNTGSSGAGWVTQTTWNDLKDNDANGLSSQWKLIQDKSDFDALANGTLAGVNGRKIVGTVKSYDGKQQYRGGLAGNDYTTTPLATPLKTDVPTLTTMVQGALKVLPTNGFFLGIEQGEVDRAMHSNNLGRMIEAQTEFDATVAWLDALLNANAGNPNLPNYANTLVVVSADHDHQLYGAASNTTPFAPIIDNGDGNMPGALFQTGNHSNHLVPVFAKGAGSELLALYADQTDAYTDGTYTFGRGAYLDQGELFNVFNTAVVPEPSAISLLALPLAHLLRRRR